MRFERAVCAGWCVLALSACRPEFEDDYWRVDSPRVLAVKSEPAEAKPGTRLVFSAFLSSSEGASAMLDWNFCMAPKPLTENNAVAAACLGPDELVAAGSGLSLEVATPAAGCSLFGPNSPPGGFRPRDPDVTGGYYQPLRVDLSGSEPTFHLQRIVCDLADASSETATEFGLSYLANQNPHLETLAASVAAQSVALDEIRTGARVELSVGWPASDAESYTYYDRALQELTEKREAMRVSWYTNGGTLDTESSGRAEDDWALTAKNTWRAPEEPGTFALWVVLRDSRGGVDFARYALGVRR